MKTRPAIKLLIGLLLAFFSSTVYAASGYFNSYGEALSECNADVDSGQSCAHQGAYSGSSDYIGLLQNGSVVALYIYPRSTNPPMPTPEECSATTGNRVSQGSTSGADAAPNNLDVGGCQSVKDFCAEFPSDGTTSCNYVSNGNLTQPGDGDGSGATPLEDTAGQNCIAGGGKQVCYEPAGENEGTINGEHVDFDALNKSAPNFLPGGSVMSGPDSPTPVNGDGSPAEPDAVISGTDSQGNTTNYNYYQNGGGVNSTSNADATTAGSTTSAARSLEEIEKKQCGGAGQPKCNVVVDETGTPTGATTSSDYITKFDTAGVDGLLDGLATGVDVENITFNPLLPTPATCQVISFSWAGTSVDIPDATWCGRLDTAKTMLAYMLYIFTAFYLFNIATQRPA